MIRFIYACTFLLLVSTASAQTPVPMISQPWLTYSEDFVDITNWTSNFAAGTGANRFGAVTIAGATSIPSATRITVSSATFSTGSSGGVQKGSGQINLLSTDPADNSTSTAFDLFLDFTGVNAGTISFDWNVVFNSTGNRNGSLKVYSSTDGINFTDLSAAFVTNFTNNVAASGSISSVTLPASFNNSATARLRFYYHNGTGGTTGSRPKIGIDNISITATGTSPCTSPATQPTSLNFGSITSSSIDGSFTAAGPAPHSYLVIISSNSNLTSLPVDGINYNNGDNVGDGYVVTNSNSPGFSATGLSSSSAYYFYIFSVNYICTGGTKYLAVNPLEGNINTSAGVPPCSAPVAQPTNLVFGTTNSNSIQGSFTAANADGYLVLRSTSNSLSANPVNAVNYATGNIIGNATVVQQGNLTNFTASGLSNTTLYYFYILGYNNSGCSNGPVYNTVTALSGSRSTLGLSSCITPTAQPSNISFTFSGNAIAGAYNAGSDNDGYLIVRSLSSTLSATPVNNTDYAVGANLGGGIVIANDANKSFLTSGLSAATTYYFYVFALNKLCSGGTKYLTVNPLTGNAKTTNDPVNNYYFGNLHSHSDYSDGNQDNPGYTPAHNYQYAKASQCMDYLGVSEHNHYSNANSPGNKLSTYILGVAQANAFTLANPGFVALYGMEWGVISNGGHVLVYGDGMDNLWGWESGSGGWGTGNNYNQFVAKSDYTSAGGLFQTVVNNSASNTFASLAHPASADYGNLSTSAYNPVFDAAIAATAVENGPSTSTNTAYSHPPSSMGYLSYYLKLLAKGYHVAPTIDHDNHNTTFGRTTYSRSAVVAPALTKSEIIKGFRNRHVYATQDCDTKVDFTLNTKMMGSILTAVGAPVIAVNISDASTSTSSAVIKVMFGIPGSNVNATVIYSAVGSTLTFIDDALPNYATGYYYIDITNGSSRIITSPVWYTRQATVNTWVGSGTNDMNTAGNWSWGILPDGSNDALVPTGNTPYPVLTGNADFNNLTIESGATVAIGNNTLTINGAINGAGTITGSTVSNLVLGGTTGSVNFTAGSRILKNFTLNNSASATIGTALEITAGLNAGTVIVNNGAILTTNGNLTLKSDDNGTASVGNSAGTINGDVTVERNIANPGRRAWHLLSSNTTGTQSIYNAWQEAGGPIVANQGTLISSNEFNGSNGFNFASASASILTHNQGLGAGPSWNFSLANTNATPISAYPGYMLFVRGDRNYTATQPSPTATNRTVLKSTGNLKQGTQAAVNVSAIGTGRTLVGNPYASAIDMDPIFTGTANLIQSMYIWDPTLTGNSGVGGFRLVERNGGAYQQTPVLPGGGTTPDANSRYIHSGQAFFLKASGADASVVFNENIKTALLPSINPIVNTAADQQIFANLLIVNSGNIESLADGIRVRFDGSYVANTTDDIEKMGNFAENISSFRENKKLIVEKRPMIVLKDTIFIRMTNLGIKDYRLQIGTIDFAQATATAWLQDSYLNTNTEMNLNGTVNYVDFNVSSNPASANPDRFKIIFAVSGPLPVTITSVKAAQKGSDIEVAWKVSNQLNIQKYEIEKSTDGLNYIVAGTQTAIGTNGSDAGYSWLDQHPVTGNNFYRIRIIGNRGDIKLSQIIIVKIGKEASEITVYPNPVINKTIGIQFTNVKKGLYKLRLLNQAGQLVYTKTISHDGGSAMQSVMPGSGISKGYYRLEIIKTDNTKTITMLFITE